MHQSSPPVALQTILVLALMSLTHLLLLLLSQHLFRTKNIAVGGKNPPNAHINVTARTGSGREHHKITRSWNYQQVKAWYKILYQRLSATKSKKMADATKTAGAAPIYLDTVSSVGMQQTTNGNKNTNKNKNKRPYPGMVYPAQVHVPPVGMQGQTTTGTGTGTGNGNGNGNGNGSRRSYPSGYPGQNGMVPMVTMNGYPGYPLPYPQNVPNVQQHMQMRQLQAQNQMLQQQMLAQQQSHHALFAQQQQQHMQQQQQHMQLQQHIQHLAASNSSKRQKKTATKDNFL